MTKCHLHFRTSCPVFGLWSLLVCQSASGRGLSPIGFTAHVGGYVLGVIQNQRRLLMTNWRTSSSGVCRSMVFQVGHKPRIVQLLSHLPCSVHHLSQVLAYQFLICCLFIIQPPVGVGCVEGVWGPPPAEAGGVRLPLREWGLSATAPIWRNCLLKSVGGV